MADTRHVFWVQLVSGRGANARDFAITFETRLESVAAIEAAMADNGVVSGSKLDTVDDGRGGRMIRGRTGFAFGTAGLVSVQDYLRPVWEPEE